MAEPRTLELAGHANHNFGEYIRKYAKHYRNEDHKQEAEKIFKANVGDIVAHNMKYQTGEKSYRLGVNQFTDLTHDEFKKIYSVKLSTKVQPNAGKFQLEPGVTIPSQIDWTKKGYVTPVKDQKGYGTCWTFGATGALEGQNYKATNELLSLSEQQIVDCCKDYDPREGANQEVAFDYIMSCGGITTEKEYPYKGEIETCRFTKSQAKVRVTGYIHITRESEEKLTEAVGTVGPVSVGVDASDFQSYEGGVYDKPGSSTTELDHAMLVVGYGQEKDSKGREQDFWKVKNSWGEGWGEDGYIRMSRNKNNQCGIATFASYPLV